VTTTTVVLRDAKSGGEPRRGARNPSLIRKNGVANRGVLERIGVLPPPASRGQVVHEKERKRAEGMFPFRKKQNHMDPAHSSGSAKKNGKGT